MFKVAECSTEEFDPIPTTATQFLCTARQVTSVKLFKRDH